VRPRPPAGDGKRKDRNEQLVAPACWVSRGLVPVRDDCGSDRCCVPASLVPCRLRDGFFGWTGLGGGGVGDDGGRWWWWSLEREGEGEERERGREKEGERERERETDPASVVSPEWTKLRF
jgi:hypothetical protein